MTTRSFSIAAALAASAMAFAPMAHAAEEYRTVGVTHADLDLTTAEGKEELEKRIDRAAKEACGIGEAQVGTLIRTREQRTCYRQTKRQFDQHFARIIEDAEHAG